MKTKILSIAILLFAITSAYSQEFKLAKSSGKLVIKDLNDLTVEGHSGNEIIFSLLDGPMEKDKRAEGLRSINSMGLEDNTGLGLSVQDKGATIEVFQLKKMDGRKIKILLPKGISLSVSHSTPHGDEVKLKNIESEIEVNTLHNGVVLENVTGPLTIKTVHGEIMANLGANIKSPISLVSVHGLIDIAIPVATKATVNLSTSYGEIFVDPAIKIEVENKGEWTKYGSNKVTGKVNGGGLDLTLSSTHNNIYLRKK
jgi:hypothetical protein